MYSIQSKKYISGILSQLKMSIDRENMADPVNCLLRFTQHLTREYYDLNIKWNCKIKFLIIFSIQFNSISIQFNSIQFLNMTVTLKYFADTYRTTD